MKLDVLDLTGKKVGDVELADSVLTDFGEGAY